MDENELRVKYFVLVLTTSLTLTSPGAPVAASDVSALCSGSVTLSSGQWARYTTDAPLMKEKMESRFAIVGTEEDHYWMEFEASMPIGNGAMVIRVLIPGWPYPEGSIKRAMMQMPRIEGMDSMPPMEMPPGAVQNDQLSEPIRIACEGIENGVVETVTVPAGTFSATRIALPSLGKDIWLSPGVPFGLVKLADADNNGTILVAYGSDAQSAITEMPQKFPGTE